jgi:hypothetical protein
MSLSGDIPINLCNFQRFRGSEVGLDCNFIKPFVAELHGEGIAAEGRHIGWSVFGTCGETCGLQLDLSIWGGGSNNRTSAKVSCIGHLTRLLEIIWSFQCVERWGTDCERPNHMVESMAGRALPLHGESSEKTFSSCWQRITAWEQAERYNKARGRFVERPYPWYRYPSDSSSGV